MGALVALPLVTAEHEHEGYLSLGSRRFAFGRWHRLGALQRLGNQVLQAAPRRQGVHPVVLGSSQEGPLLGQPLEVLQELEHYKSKECKKFLKKACPSKHLEEACDYWFGGGVLGSTRSTDAPSVGPSKDEIADAFNSFQDDEKEDDEKDSGLLGAQQPSGLLPLSDLKPLLKKLGVKLSRSDLKAVKKRLDNGSGYFSLTSFFFWWTTFVICEDIFGTG